jgi:hypothetical protein
LHHSSGNDSENPVGTKEIGGGGGADDTVLVVDYERMGDPDINHRLNGDGTLVIPTGSSVFRFSGTSSMSASPTSETIELDPTQISNVTRRGRKIIFMARFTASWASAEPFVFYCRSEDDAGLAESMLPKARIPARARIEPVPVYEAKKRSSGIYGPAVIIAPINVVVIASSRAPSNERDVARIMVALAVASFLATLAGTGSWPSAIGVGWLVLLVGRCFLFLIE